MHEYMQGDAESYLLTRKVTLANQLLRGTLGSLPLLANAKASAKQMCKKPV